MYRHIFTAAFKDGVTDEVKQERVEYLRKMKDMVPQVADLHVNLSMGWTGPDNRIVLTADVESKEAFDVYAALPYHLEFIKVIGEYFVPETIVVTQFEL